MKQPYYTFKTNPTQLTFTFESISYDKSIQKIVIYTPFYENDEVYNLAFGDIISDGEFDDEAVSNNKDANKILATVIQTILVFFETYPTKTVFLTGSTPARTRLYQIIINREASMLSEQFDIKGIRNGLSEVVVPNIKYDAFLIKLKTKK